MQGHGLKKKIKMLQVICVCVCISKVTPAADPTEVVG